MWSAPARRLGLRITDRGQRAFRVKVLTWIAERSFAWLGRNRRFRQDYEYKVQTSETLIPIAERQQAAVRVALDGLAAERVALAREPDALARGVRDVQIGAQGAVRSAVADSLAGVAAEGVAAVQAATAPLLARLAGVTEQAGQANAALRNVVAWGAVGYWAGSWPRWRHWCWGG